MVRVSLRTFSKHLAPVLHWNEAQNRTRGGTFEIPETQRFDCEKNGASTQLLLPEYKISD